MHGFYHSVSLLCMLLLSSLFNQYTQIYYHNVYLFTYMYTPMKRDRRPGFDGVQIKFYYLLYLVYVHVLADELLCKHITIIIILQVFNVCLFGLGISVP